MYKLPEFAGSKKCWWIINNLVFGEGLACPERARPLPGNYQARYF